MLMKPIPPELGVIQLTVTRDTSSVKTKLWPKYYLSISGIKNSNMLKAKKLKTSKTPHYRIVVHTDNKKLETKVDQSYLGRLRSGIKGGECQIYDSGVKTEKEVTAEYPLRR